MTTRETDPLRCRYSDCPEGHPLASVWPDDEDCDDGAPIAATQEETERVTCEACRADMGLPTIAEDEAANRGPTP